MTARELAKKQHDAKLVEFAKRAKELCEKVQKGEESTLALGKLLLKVKTYNPHGGLRAWIVKNIGSDVSTRNRCNYAMSLANGKHQKQKAAKNASEREHVGLLKEMRTALRALLKAIETGDLTDVSTSRDIIVRTVDALVKKAEAAAFNRNRKEHLEDLSRKSNPAKRAAGAKALATEFENQVTATAEKAAAATV
jgi:hypothetical protein